MTVSTVDYLRARPRTRDAYRYILRLIRSRGLGHGDRLPTQERLRRDSTFGHNTLTGAMRMLVREGVLRRRTGLGTVVVDPRANRESIWTVGLTYPSQTIGGYFPTLVFFLKQFLHQADCDDRTYLATGDTVVDGQVQTLDVIPGLADDLGTRLDAVLTPLHISTPEAGLVVSVGSSSSPLAVYIDDAGWAGHATARLAEAGCRRFALVESQRTRPGRGPLVTGYEQARAGGLRLPEPLVIDGGNYIEGGCRAAEHLLELPARCRPDAVLVASDMHCMGLAGTLARCRSYRPQVATLVNRQLPMMFALPVWRWELDLEALARRAVHLMVDHLQSTGVTTDRQEPITPQAVGDGPTW